jgi:hypothetical protein
MINRVLIDYLEYGYLRVARLILRKRLTRKIKRSNNKIKRYKEKTNVTT